jgi:RNA ligase (TIGR02306 family)
MKRKLARIERIDRIEAIENADAIESAVVNGWKSVIRKDEGFKAGDLILFFEIDSYLSIEPRYEFLRKYSYKKVVFADGNPEGHRTEGFRIKTVKLRGVYSQGLIMPLSAFEKEIRENFPTNNDTDISGAVLDEGTDFTDILDIKLFVKPIPREQAGIVKGGLPHSIPTTEQERIQNLPGYFDEYKEMGFEVTEKIDGFSTTVYWYNGEFGVCKRNWELLEDESNVFWKVARKLDLENILKEIGRNIALQGELAGEGINKNPLQLTGKRYFLFDTWDIDQRRYLNADERKEIFDEMKARCDVAHVPVVDKNFKVFKEYPVEKMDDLVKMANGKSLVTKGRSREGLVLKSNELVNGQTVSFKVLDNKYLLKQEKEVDG